MNEKSHTTRYDIDHSPNGSMMVKLALSGGNAADAVGIIIKNIFGGNTINAYDLPAWTLAFELMAESLKSQMSIIGSDDKVYNTLRESIKVNTISFVPSINENGKE